MEMVTVTITDIETGELYQIDLFPEEVEQISNGKLIKKNYDFTQLCSLLRNAINFSVFVHLQIPHSIINSSVS